MVARVGNDGRTQLAALLFEPGMRPDIAAISLLADQGSFAISMQPDPAAGWAELLCDGLTFDLAGLAPSPPVALPVVNYRFGLPADFSEARYEALGLLPGPHLAGAEALLPVVRGATALLLELAKLPGVAGISWLPAANLLSPEWFERSAKGWLDNGPFAAFALVSLARRDEAVVSHGLKFLNGQEFTLSADLNRTLSAPVMVIAVRLLDWLVAHGKLVESRTVELVGVGAVELVVKDEGSIAARCR